MESKLWYRIDRIESVDLCGYANDTSYHPTRSGAPYWVLALMESGQRTLTVDGVPVKVKKGDFKILPPGSRQLPLELDHMSAYYIHFRADGGKIAPPRKIESETPLLPQCDHLPVHPDCLALARYLYEQSRKPYVGQAFLQSQLQALLLTLSMQAQHNLHRSGVSVHNERILEFLEANLCANLQAEDYEAAFGLSYHQLNAVFKQNFGCTMKQYHQKLRMRHAAQLLLSGKSAREAAASCGYEDYYYFIRCFTKAYGTAPGRYQHQNGIR